MSSDLLLSICILSYNQPKEVERLLESIASQVAPAVEVLIRDDSTNDETLFVVEKFSRSFPIRYFRGKKEGIDKTIIFLTIEAKGKFVWWMGDDVIVPDGITSILRVINKYVNHVTFIWANYRLFNGEKLAIDLPIDQFFKSRDQVLELGGAALGFVSSTIIKRDSVLSGIEKSKKHVGSAFVNLYLVLHVISQPGDHYYVRGEVVICHPTTSADAKASVVDRNGVINNWAFQVFGINFAVIVNEFSKTFSRQARRKTIKRSFGQTWRGMVVAYVGGWDSPRGKRIQMIRHFWTFPECWVALVLFAMPRAVLERMYKIYKKIYNK
ncbi:MAG: glycosyltransferase [Polaromonas sp.]|nr:glycosyltransferase [Polaromonas sp.]MDP3751405.1 glycosyltransferase [Polaromonas sp.]